MKTMSGFSSEAPEKEGKAESALPLSGFGGDEVKDTQRQSDASIRHIDAFGEVKSKGTDKFEEVNVFNAIADKVEQPKEKSDTERSFFKGIKFEDDTFEQDDTTESDDVVADVSTTEVLRLENQKTEVQKEVSQSESIEPKTVKQEIPKSTEPKASKVSSVNSEHVINKNISGIMNKVDELNEHPLSFLMKCFGACYGAAAKVVKRASFSKIVKKGVRIQSGDFEFVKASDYLILTKYSGINNVVRIPAVVGNLPVKYIHPDFLYSGVNPFDNYKFRSIVSAIKGLSTASFEEDLENKFISDVTEVQLPNTLVAISDSTFVGCSGIRELVIPASVKSFNYNAIKDSGIVSLYFNGNVPRGFNTKKFRGNIFVREDSYARNI